MSGRTFLLTGGGSCATLIKDITQYISHRRECPVVSTSAAHQAYSLLKTDIINCTLRPGTLIMQPQLAETYQLGVTPVREALQRLVREGFVRSIPHYGYMVNPVSLADVREIFELRSIIESDAARLAAQRAPDELLQRIASSADFSYVFRDPQTYTDFLRHNTEFHHAVALASGNARLSNTIALLLEELMRVFHLGLDLRDSAEEMREEHVALAQLLLSRDADGAERTVLTQIGRSQQRITEALTRLLSQSVVNGAGDGIIIGER